MICGCYCRYCFIFPQVVSSLRQDVREESLGLQRMTTLVVPSHEVGTCSLWLQHVATLESYRRRWR